MKFLLPLMGLISLLWAPSARAEVIPPRPFTEGTRVTLVGKITSHPKDFIIDEDKMQVAVGPDRVDHTLHLNHARIWGYNGKRIKNNDLANGMWVRAEGKIMNDPRRIMVSSLQVIGRNNREYRESAFYRPGLEPGYVETVAGSREYYASTKPFRTGDHVTLVGRITSHPKDFLVDEDKMQVAVGDKGREFTLHLDKATVLNATGSRIKNNDLANDMWVRAEGTVMEDGRRIQVRQIQVLGRSWDQYAGSAWFDADADHGYIYATDVP